MGAAVGWDVHRQEPAGTDGFGPGVGFNKKRLLCGWRSAQQRFLSARSCHEQAPFSNLDLTRWIHYRSGLVRAGSVAATQLEGVAVMTIFEYASALALMLGSLAAASGSLL
jgi:hypothetical protein